MRSCIDHGFGSLLLWAGVFFRFVGGIGFECVLERNIGLECVLERNIGLERVCKHDDLGLILQRGDNGRAVRKLQIR